MTNDQLIRRDLSEHIRIIEIVRETLSESIFGMGRKLVQVLADGGTLFWCGNGGSAADSQHLTAELIGRSKKNVRGLRSIALSTDTSVLTSLANDYGYDDIFARQVEALGRPGDALIGISTSGKSENVLRALKAAKASKMTVFALLGNQGGAARDLADDSLVIPSDSTARVQEAHILIGHILCDFIEQELGLA